MNEARLWYIELRNMGCKFLMDHMMPHVAFATGHANGRQLDTTAGALKTRLETWDAKIKFSLRTPSFQPNFV